MLHQTASEEVYTRINCFDYFVEVRLICYPIEEKGTFYFRLNKLWYDQLVAVTNKVLLKLSICVLFSLKMQLK